eukprot:5238650-Pyramimonas_sp.AAC.1
MEKTCRQSDLGFNEALVWHGSFFPAEPQLSPWRAAVKVKTEYAESRGDVLEGAQRAHRIPHREAAVYRPIRLYDAVRVECHVVLQQAQHLDIHLGRRLLGWRNRKTMRRS